MHKHKEQHIFKGQIVVATYDGDAVKHGGRYVALSDQTRNGVFMLRGENGASVMAAEDRFWTAGFATEAYDRQGAVDEMAGAIQEAAITILAARLPAIDSEVKLEFSADTKALIAAVAGAIIDDAARENCLIWHDELAPTDEEA